MSTMEANLAGDLDSNPGLLLLNLEESMDLVTVDTIGLEPMVVALTAVRGLEQNAKPEPNRTVKVRPNPPIIPPPKKQSK